MLVTLCLFKPTIWNHSLAKIAHKLQLCGLTMVGLRVLTLDKRTATSLLPAQSVTDHHYPSQAFHWYKNVRPRWSNTRSLLRAGPLGLGGPRGVPVLRLLIGSLPPGGKCCKQAAGCAGPRCLVTVDPSCRGSFIQWHLWSVRGSTSAHCYTIKKCIAMCATAPVYYAKPFELSSTCLTAPYDETACNQFNRIRITSESDSGREEFFSRGALLHRDQRNETGAGLHTLPHVSPTCDERQTSSLCARCLPSRYSACARTRWSVRSANGAAQWPRWTRGRLHLQGHRDTTQVTTACLVCFWREDNSFVLTI